MSVNKKIPKSRLMIQYDTRVDGQKKKKELPYRVLMMGNVSNGTSKDAQLSLQDRQIRNLKNGVDATMKDMEIPVNLTVANYINPQKSATIDVNYILSGMKDFRPDQIAEKVPQIKALLTLKEMLVRFEKDVDNNRMIKDSIDRVFSNKDAVSSLKSSLPELQKYAFKDHDAEVIEGEVITEEENS
ncbi:type VI secretion system contractile sheath small subunit [Facilibium subflavum]|uniref:type VI secretion system contractile sheath small subunit n=1 Tax=Facilibium subflavum TaxID=2219058 RepID=UPI000E64A396|nr:type VI secretion system contractile sheath small subunit [Facilibium subflavum]